MFSLPSHLEKRRTFPVPALRADSDPGADAERAHGLSPIRSIRLETLVAFAPFLSFASAFGAVLVAWLLGRGVDPALLFGWGVCVLTINFFALRTLGRLAFDNVGGVVPASTVWRADAVIALCAAVWALLPAYGFAGLDPRTQVVLAGLVCAMMGAGLTVAIAPGAALGWISALAAVFLAGMLSASAGLAADLVVLILFCFAVTAAGAIKVAEGTAQHLRKVAAEQDRSRALTLLMKEYEEQGTSWLWQTDAENRLSYVSPRIAVLLGQSTNQLLGQSFPAALGGTADLGGALLARKPFTGVEIEVSTSAGLRWLSFSGTPIVDGAAVFRGFRGTSSDVTETRSSEQRLRQLASLDVLTGLPNRMRVRELFGQALEIAGASGTPCGIFFLDLDGFKPVNDTFGHHKGDAVLQTVAQRLTETVGKDGIVGRIGGDEFAVVLHDIQNRRAVADLAERLISRISTPYLLDNSQVRIGLSIGSAYGPIDGNDVDDLLKKADLALYEAKAQGRGKWRHFDPKMQSEAEERVLLELDLRQALPLKQFRLLYQPIVDAASQEVVGFEALLRWQHPVRGSVSPAVFVPIAEEIGLIGEIGEWVVQNACRAAAGWPHHITVAVNLSPLQLLLPSLPTTVSDALARAKLQANRLELEVTESVFLQDSDGSMDVLRRLRAIGVRIALDDFGTGYSSLGYLNKTIFHKLKIDGSFVRAAGSRPETVSIIQAIVTLANCFQMTITAEGVETNDDYRRMQELGCHQIQGYLFGRPLPYEKATELVGTRWEQPRSAAG